MHWKKVPYIFFRINAVKRSTYFCRTMGGRRNGGGGGIAGSPQEC